MARDVPVVRAKGIFIASPKTFCEGADNDADVLEAIGLGTNAKAECWPRMAVATRERVSMVLEAAVMV